MISVVMTILTLAGVLVLMIGILYALKWVISKSPAHLFKSSDNLKIMERQVLDNKRSFVRCQFSGVEYTLLLGESDLLLDKKSISGESHG
jgi:flagellar biogenesis protein FliO